MAEKTIFYQLFEQESSTFTYLVADALSREAALIDPVLETVERDLQLIRDLDLNLKYVLDTHIHADHITGSSEIRKRTGAKTAVSENAQVACADIALKEGQELTIGATTLKAFSTPGHTDSCMSFVWEDKVFTGDALLIRGCGRTDFQQGSADRLYDSVHGKLFSLAPAIQVYPAHDYKGHTHSTIELEKKFNPRLGVSVKKSEFVKIMSELKLAYPKKIHEALPANLVCGDLARKTFVAEIKNGVPEVSVKQVRQNLGKVRLVDVRSAEEFNGELGHIPGAELVPQGEALEKFLQVGDRLEQLVFICRTGRRSEEATRFSLQLGYRHTANMVGGMTEWNNDKGNIYDI